jgi:ABC-type transporter lipoprotein component MlaA
MKPDAWDAHLAARNEFHLFTETPHIYTADEIKAMSMDEYAKVRDVLLQQAKEEMELAAAVAKRHQEILEAEQVERNASVTCVWCGKDCGSRDARDEHEDECGL